MTGPERRVFVALSNRQKEVVLEIISGGKNKEIAAALGVQLPAVKKLVKSIFDKTGMGSRVELAVFIVSHPALNRAIEEHVEKYRLKAA